jgi:enterochelin esterase-like enzyme
MELSFNPQPFEMSWVSMPRWTPPAHLNEPNPHHRGRLEKRTLASKALESDIEIDVYLPADYDDGDQRYPVAYVLDRDAAGESGRYPQSLDNLIGHSVRPVIAVFLDAAPWFKNQQHAQMLATELVPYVDENFRTMASADARACLGTGFGSGDALLCTMGNPTVIGKVACQSPFMFSTLHDAVTGMLAGMQGAKPLVYVDWGKYDLRNPHENWNTADRARELVDTLRKNGCTVVGGEANDGCDWPSWRNRTDKVFAAVFPLENGK